MKHLNIKRAATLLVLGIGLVGVGVFGIGGFLTNSHAQSNNTQIKGGNLVLQPIGRLGSHGFVQFNDLTNTTRSVLYIYETDLLRLSNKAGTDMMRIDSNGKIFANGVGQISSRSVKDNIINLPESDALTAFSQLNPVLYNYKNDTDRQAGFIAEDVPDVIAAPDHKSINPLEVTALLTSVLKAQQKQLETQQKQIQEMQREIEGLKRK